MSVIVSQITDFTICYKQLVHANKTKTSNLLITGPLRVEFTGEQLFSSQRAYKPQRHDVILMVLLARR